MHDDSVLVAIEAALHSTQFCTCGSPLDLGAHDGTLWLECPTFTRQSRLPAPIAVALRSLLHDRRLVA